MKHRNLVIAKSFHCGNSNTLFFQRVTRNHSNRTEVIATSGISTNSNNAWFFVSGAPSQFGSASLEDLELEHSPLFPFKITSRLEFRKRPPVGTGPSKLL
jgi:hypothetical protein